VPEFLVPPDAGTRDERPAPTFSIVVAAYNVASLIGDALDSAFAQREAPHEVIVCDDGSTDELDVVLAPYMNRITLIRKENGGEASAKNAASRAASGEFVAILDADDIYLPGRLEALAALATARPDLDILTTDAHLEVDGRRVRRAYTHEWTFAVDDQRTAILERNFIFGHAAVRRERLVAVGGFDEKIRRTTDWDCWIRLILDGSRAGCVAEPLSIYRVRPDALSAARLPMLEGRLQTLVKASARADLSPAEFATVSRTLGRHRRELDVLELREALRERRPDARRRALAVARNRDLPGGVRAKAVVAALLPALAGRRERQRAAAGWTGAGGTLVRGR
jgi:Glycosyl transferase family 2